ncbi:MAG: LysR family transcriptional regulator [Pseudomonadota bacterium]
MKVDVLDLGGRSLTLMLELIAANTVGAAAERCGMALDDAYHHISEMRAALGDPLFDEVDGQIVPTAFALSLENGLRAQLAGLEALRKPVSFDPATLTKRITIAANVTEMLRELIDIRDAISRAAPQAPVRFLELGARENIEPMLKSAVADLVITVSAQDYPAALTAEPFLEDRHVCFYDPDVRGPVSSVEDYALAEHATLDFGGDAPSNVEIALAAETINRNVRLSAPDVGALGVMMRGTPLIATMQSRLHGAALSHLAYCEPPVYLPRQKFDLVWHRQNSHEGRTQWLIGVAKDAVAAVGFARE